MPMTTYFTDLWFGVYPGLLHSFLSLLFLSKENQNMRLQYLGHSAFRIVTNGGKSILIDPFVDRNPLATLRSEQLSADYIVLTHAHGDHLGDTLSIARKGSTTIVGVGELMSMFAEKGHKTHSLQIGGSFNFDFGRLKLVPALHGSLTPDGRYAGLAASVLLSIEGKNIYHCGDTGIFGDMKLIGEMNPIDLVLIPIGGNYTMDIADALWALDLIKPKLSIPMHYNTFPLIKADPEEFAKLAEKKGYQVEVMQIGQEIAL